MKRLADEEGSALVEMGISASLALMVLFAIIEFSFAFYSYNFIAEASKEAVRYASVRGACTDPDSGSVTNKLSDCANTSAQLTTLVKGMGYPGINPDNITTVAVTWPNGDSYPGHNVRVDITYKFPLSVPFWKATDLYLHSTAQMVISN